MKRMHDEGGNDNYTALIRELTLLYYKQSLDLVNRLALETNTYLIWSRKYLPPYFNTAYEVDFEGDKISIVGKVSILPGNLEDIMEIDGYFDKQYYNPFDVLIVDFNTKANCIGIEGPLQMPVFMFKWMMDNIYYNTPHSLDRNDDLLS